MAARIHKVAGELGLTKTKLQLLGLVSLNMAWFH